ncbi:MAG: carboxypeptidase-like regulatory domain-containing protein [Caulobacteraceae bacterium]
MSHKPIPIAGHVGGVGETDAARLSIVALRGDTVIATTRPRPDGGYTLNLPHEAVHADSAFALQLAVLPSTAAAHPGKVTDAPRATIKREALKGEHPIEAPPLSLDAGLLDKWAIFWPEWCVSGTVVGPNGCPAPAADVTVYTVSWGLGGYNKYAQTSVTTGPDGTFTLCFPWWDELFPCWSCEPFWWDCWPWWWEIDILHVIEALETRASRGAQSVALFRPESHALIRGQGFAKVDGLLQRDPARTALIARKFANPALRAIFPWRWWCCDEPNIVFGVTQGATTILAEDPSFDTRWCMESGQNVTLTGSSSTLTYCPGGPLPESGMVWTSVGNILTTSIDTGGLAQGGGDNSDVAFQGSLWLYAAIAPGTLDYYQVNGSVWNQPQSRGGTKPAPAAAPATAPIAAQLWLPVWIYDPATLTTTAYSVQMGPFSANGYIGLYATPEARQSQPTPPGMAPFPPIPAGGLVFWGEQGLILIAQDMTLLGGATFGAVDLTLLGFDGGYNPVAVAPDAPLTLTVDSTPITTQRVNGITAWVSPGVPATQTGVGDCPAYDVGPAGFVEISVTAQDNNGYLCQYELEAQYGHGSAVVVTPPGLGGYVSNPLVVSATNPDYAAQSWVGGTETIVFPGATLGGALPPDCCYEFRLYFSKRVTDGYYWPTGNLAEGDFQTISLKFSS